MMLETSSEIIDWPRRFIGSRMFELATTVFALTLVSFFDPVLRGRLSRNLSLELRVIKSYLLKFLYIGVTKGRFQKK